ncbi:MAG: class I adenylate-forming enzyme family protein [Chthoniobacterales bacterium]
MKFPKSDDALLNAWNETLARKGDAPAIFNTGGSVVRTFRQIEERARAIQAKTPQGGPHEINAVQIGNHEDWPSVLLACLRSRRIILPIDESISKEQADAAISIATRSGSVDWGDQAPTFFKLTSGTTAEPRIIRFRSEQLLADCDQILATMGIEDVDLNFGAIPISHSYGFSNLLTPLIARGVPLVLSRDRTPRALLVDLARTGPTVFPGTPVLFQALADIEDVRPLSKLRLCISAGAPLPMAVARRFRDRFKLPIHSFYGASECGGICYDREAANEFEGFVGPPMKDVDLEMLDAHAPSTQVRVRSAAAGDGYLPEPDEIKLGPGYFVPDDLLTKTPAGFRLVGRVSDVINVAGKKVNPAEVEAHLLRFRGVRQAVVFGRESTRRTEEVAACVVAERHVREPELLQFCRETLSPWQAPKRIFFVEELPVTERGKISRRELGQRFALH